MEFLTPHSAPTMKKQKTVMNTAKKLAKKKTGELKKSGTLKKKQTEKIE